MRHFAASSGDTVSSPTHIYRDRIFRSYGVSNGRFSIQAHVGGGQYATGWVSANGDCTNLYGGSC